ncbi:site-specific recombinase XerD [Sphingomonas aerolata]|uniref:Site-specific recombinase XerD n=2 Tax=Sphingomonas aerolata TaxID=185951 RepID=A0A2T4YN46_9SPHN|nr:site-specific recombinase XerD [Sphingomonas aerolata]
MPRAYATQPYPPGLRMSLSCYLCKRDNSQHWQLRMMVPKALRPAIGRREFTRSLGVTDKKQAEALAYPILGQWKATIAAASTPSVAATLPESSTSYVPSSRELEEVAVTVGYEEAGRRVSDLIRSKARVSEDAYRALAPEFQRRHTNALRCFHAEDHTYWEAVARRAASSRGWCLPDDSLEFRSFVESLAKCGIELFASAQAKVEGRADDFRPSAYVRNAIERRGERLPKGEGLLEMFDKYRTQRLSEGRKKADTLNQDRKVIELLSDYVGENRSIDSLKKSELREWRNAVAALPSAYKKRAAYEGLSIQQAVEKAHQTNERGISLITVNKYLSAVSALYIWALREGYVNENPCTGLFYDADKRKNSRPPFSADQLNTILRSPLFVGFVGPKEEHKVGQCRADDWRYWLPLICLFTGARIGEVAQIRLSDVRFEDGEWYFLIANDDEAGLSTKNKQSRIAPMHSLLRSIGFLEFVDRQKRGANPQKDNPLFPDLVRNDRGQAGLPSRFWRDYLKRIGIKNGPDGFGSHSFRHGLADQLRQSGCFDNEVAVAIGHKQTSVTSGYGRTRQGSAMKLNQMIESAKFQGVDFSGLIANARVFEGDS